MSQPKSIKCSKCGAALGLPQSIEPEMRLVCGACGHKMKVRQPEPAREVVAQPLSPPSTGGGISPTTVMIMALLFVGAGIGIGFAMTQLNSNSSEKPDNTSTVASSDKSNQKSDTAADNNSTSETNKNSSESPSPPVTKANTPESAVDKLAKVSTEDVKAAATTSANSGRRFLSASGRELAVGDFVSFDGAVVVIKLVNKEQKRIPIDELRKEDQEFVFKQPANSRADLPPESKTQVASNKDLPPSGPPGGPPPSSTAPAMNNPNGPDGPAGPPADAPPGYPVVRDWVNADGQPMIRGEFAGMKPGDRVIIKLLSREWTPVEPVNGQNIRPFRGVFWVFYEEAPAGPGQKGTVMVRVGEATIPGHSLSWIDIPLNSFSEPDQEYLGAIEGLRNYASVPNNKFLHFQVPILELSQPDQDYVLSELNPRPRTSPETPQPLFGPPQ
ncbi:hypothetical protein [Rubinisphaera italica]|uniref:SLA1 homology domain-containing protein n=1 Tax=Rubinisphaera italica TaxID=2527969 RepID=A0A5C5XGC9_9PLAN|nr:hypothetical protein [Rubinisphaera italica]TWT61235.1 hypothetical protein Pan54_19700 [Rubinisphaera italica]